MKAYKQHLSALLRKYKEETKIFYVNVGHISFDIIPISMALKRGYRVITHSHNAMQEPIKRFDYRLRQAILRFIAMNRLRNLNVVRLAVSAQAGDYLYKGIPFEIITPGIETERFQFNHTVRDAYRKELGFENCLVLGYVGRLVSVKNPIFLIDILRELNNAGRSVKLIIVGDGDLKEKILLKAEESGVQDLLVLTGNVNNVPDYLCAMDVLLAPSLSEGLGLFIVEAQAAGLPCVCASGNIPETIDVTGEVVFEDLHAGSVKWCKEIDRVLSSKLDRRAMNKKVELSSFNITNASRNLLEVINNASKS